MPSQEFLIILAAAVVVLVAISPEAPVGQAPPPVTSGSPSPGRRVTTASGLMYDVVADGTGPPAQPGNTVRIHETLTLPDGRVIFTSRRDGRPVTFVLGARQVIAGAEEGVTGMRVGERRQLVVPPALDGRTFDPAFIPPDAVRHYDIELVEIVK